MNYKNQLGILTAASILGFTLGIFGFCGPDKNLICRNDLADISLSIWMGSLSVLITSLILLFTKEQVFHTWGKFAAIYLPLAVILLIIAAGEQGGGGFGLPSIDSEIITWWTAGLFLVISLAIIAVKSWKLRKST